MRPRRKQDIRVCLILLLLTTSTLSSTIELSPANLFSTSGNLFNNLQSTWNSGSQQKQQLNNIFSGKDFFSSIKTSQTGVGNNILQGGNNQMQGTDNKLSGSNNTLIGRNTTIVGDLNKAFGLSNTIFGDKN